MEESHKWKKWPILLALLLLLLLVSATALGISLVSRNRQAHPTVTVPLETASEPPEPSTEAAEATVETTQETTVPATEETTAPTTAKTAAPTAPPSSQTEATLLQLHKRQEGDNVPFYAVNLFPGDSVTQYFCVRVSHSDSVTLRYRANVRPGYDALAEVLRCRIQVKGLTLYDGLMRDMPSSINHHLAGANRSEDVVYQITAYLDTSVGNAYQNRELAADFQWWIEETDNLASPKTGDSSGIGLWALLALLSLAALLVLLCLLYRRNRPLARLLAVLLALTLLVSALCVTAYAATRVSTSLRDNWFRTGTVDINLNDGNPVVSPETDAMFARFEPGMTTKSPFFIRNQGTGPVYYKLYFDQVEGDLAKVLRLSVTRASDGAVLYDSDLSHFTRMGVGPTTLRLEAGERQELLLWLHYPEDAGNDGQKKELTFVLCADAVQTQNNPNGAFH